MYNHNFYQEVSVSGVASFPGTSQAYLNIKGQRQMMFVCTSGTVEYSFNGVDLHGKISSGQIYNFGTRNSGAIWFRGTGVVQVHAWVI